jgi:uncharacterized protein
VRRTLEEVLASVSDVLFPGDAGERLVTIDSRDLEGDTPLHVMAWRNDAEGVDILVRAGANVNAVGDMGQTPLHVAIAQGNAAMVAVLLRAGARDDIRSEFGDTPREAASACDRSIARLFENR